MPKYTSATSEGLTRGRDMTETQSIVWLMLPCVQYNTSEQHNDWQWQDNENAWQTFESRNPLNDNCSLRSIAAGIIAGISVNVDTTKEVGEIFSSMKQQLQRSLKKIPNCHT